MLFLKNKNPVGRKRELGGSRFSCIYKRPQSELKSARLKHFSVPGRYRAGMEKSMKRRL